MWYALSMLQRRRERLIQRYTKRINNLTEAIDGIGAPYEDVAAELETYRASYLRKRARLSIKQRKETS